MGDDLEIVYWGNLCYKKLDLTRTACLMVPFNIKSKFGVIVSLHMLYLSSLMI